MSRCLLKNANPKSTEVSGAGPHLPGGNAEGHRFLTSERCLQGPELTLHPDTVLALRRHRLWSL